MTNETQEVHPKKKRSKAKGCGFVVLAIIALWILSGVAYFVTTTPEEREARLEATKIAAVAKSEAYAATATLEASWTATPTLTPTVTPTPLPTSTPINWDAVQRPEYRDYFRNAEQYLGKLVVFTGEIFQVINQSNGDTCFLIDVREPGVTYSSGDHMLACGTFATRLLEDDTVTFGGTATGIYTYETVLGAEQQVPSMSVTWFNLWGD